MALLLAFFVPLVMRAASPPPRQSTGSDQLVAPATPLVSGDPYFSIWSPADGLVEWSNEKIEAFRVLKVGSVEQPVLAKKGDDVRIDWGYLYVAAPEADKPSAEIAPAGAIRNDFASNGVFRAHYDGPIGAVAARSASVGAF